MPDALTPLDLDAIEAAIAECRTYNFGMYQADRLAHEHAPALVAEVKRLRAEVAIARQHQREASSTIRSVEGLRKERDDALAEVARLRTMVGDCHCDKNPETTNGPEEDCPQHGRPVAEVWGLVERAEAEWDHARAEVDRLRAEVRLAKASARPAPAWDEEAVAEAVRKDLEAAGILPWTNGGARIVRTALAVVREHLPVKPSREEVARALALVGDYDGCFERLDAWAAASSEARECGDVEEPMSTDGEDAEWWLKRADAILDLLPGRSEAEVKAEALNEAADWLADMDDGRDTGQHRAGRDIIARLRDRADRTAAEGGADRG